MTGPSQEQPARVVAGPMQVGDIRGLWSWVEALVWTVRMLTALEQGERNERVPHSEWDLQPGRIPFRDPSTPSWVRPPTGEPCAGDPPARFGGRGGRETGLPYPYPGEEASGTRGSRPLRRPPIRFSAPSGVRAHGVRPGLAIGGTLTFAGARRAPVRASVSEFGQGGASLPLAVTLRPEADRNRVPARGGGEHLKANERSAG